VEGAADADFSFLFRVNERILHKLTLQALCVRAEGGPDTAEGAHKKIQQVCALQLTCIFARVFCTAVAA
jgi:hypothetical protein